MVTVPSFLALLSRSQQKLIRSTVFTYSNSGLGRGPTVSWDGLVTSIPGGSVLPQARDLAHAQTGCNYAVNLHKRGEFPRIYTNNLAAGVPI